MFLCVMCVAASISGRVFFDPNENGVFDGGEPGLAGVRVAISQGGTPLSTAVTGASGSYAFPNLSAGTYEV